MSVAASMPALTGGAATTITGAIRSAAQVTGTSFQYLLATAKIESGLDPNLSMKSSSATGLFQFIDQTWLGTLKQAGPAFGYSRYADAISRTSSGRYVVQDPGLRQEIMRLRKDPAANAVMAGAFTQQNAIALGDRLGRKPSEGELYMAHFFGSGGASKLIRLASADPAAKAADFFPAAARANHSIFYDKQGGARSVSGVYAELGRRYQVARATTPDLSRNASAADLRRPTSVAPTSAPDTAGMASAFAASVPQPPASPELPVFHSLFQTGERRDAVAPAVAALWTAPSGAAPARSAQTLVPQTAALQPVAAPAGVNSTLDLFRDRFAGEL
jgi:hypothetical protein